MPKVQTNSEEREAPHIPRPPNAFMIYRKERSKFQRPAGQDRNQGHISKEIAAKWKAMSPAERAIWEQKAQTAKEEHSRQYPGYKFQPKQKNKKGDQPSKRERSRSSSNDREATPPPPIPPLELYPLDPPLPPPPSINWDLPPLETIEPPQPRLEPLEQGGLPLDNTVFFNTEQAPEHQLQFFFNAELALNQLDFTVPPPAFVPQTVASSVEVSYADHITEPNLAAPLTSDTLLPQPNDFSFYSSVPSTSTLSLFPGLSTAPNDCYFPGANDFSGLDSFHVDGSGMTFAGLDTCLDFSLPPLDSTQGTLLATSSSASLNDQDQRTDSYPVPGSSYIPPPGASNVLRRVGADWSRAVVGAR